MAEKSEIIAHAIAGKFSNLTIEELVDRVGELAKTRDCEQDDEARDICNQLHCFNLLENDWIHRNLDFSLLTEINAAARGMALNSISVRETNNIEDFHGELPTSANEIHEKLPDLLNILALVDTLDREKINDSEFADYLSRLFVTEIAIHPFEDGNGRTSRFLVEMLLNRFGYEYIIIPKYKNDEEWRLALDMAMQGDLTKVRNYFATRLRRRTHEQV